MAVKLFEGIERAALIKQEYVISKDTNSAASFLTQHNVSYATLMVTHALLKDSKCQIIAH